MSAAACIVGTGARTPLGMTAAAGAAAVRGAISAVRVHPTLIDCVGDPIPSAFDAELDPALWGAARCLTLAMTALREACAPLASTARLRLPIYLALPEFRPGFTETDAKDVRVALARTDEMPISISEVHVSAGGHAAYFSMLSMAVEQIRRGALDACLIGGVDSYFHPETMKWLDDRRQLVGTVARSGLVPGEGAGFCLVTSDPVRQQLGLQVRARVVGVSVGTETRAMHSSESCLGAGLTAVVQGVVDSAGSGAVTIDSVICDINGERYRAEEWGFVCLRLSKYFADPTAYCSPADCWGDMGAASGSLFTILACEAARRGYSRGPRSMLWAGSASGLRGAALLETMVGA